MPTKKTQTSTQIRFQVKTAEDYIAKLTVEARTYKVLLQLVANTRDYLWNLQRLLEEARSRKCLDQKTVKLLKGLAEAISSEIEQQVAEPKSRK